jgi:hypothetical protein
MNSLKTDEDRCMQMIINAKPTQISFYELKSYYKNFLNIKSADGVRKRRVIVYELKKVEQKTLGNLNQFRQDIENLSFINDSNKIDNFLEALNQAVVL